MAVPLVGPQAAPSRCLDGDLDGGGILLHKGVTRTLTTCRHHCSQARRHAAAAVPPPAVVVVESRSSCHHQPARRRWCRAFPWIYFLNVRLHWIPPNVSPQAGALALAST